MNTPEPAPSTPHPIEAFINAAEGKTIKHVSFKAIKTSEHGISKSGGSVVGNTRSHLKFEFTDGTEFFVNKEDL